VYYPVIILVAFASPSPLLLLLANLSIGTAISLYLYRRTLRTHTPSGGVEEKALAYGKKLSLSNLPAVLATQIDNLLVFHFLGAAQLALYVLITILPEKITGLFKFLYLATIPKYAVQTDAVSKKILIGKQLRVGGAALLLVLLFILAAPFIFKIFFPTYIEAIPYTSVYALSVFTVLGYLPIARLIAEAKKSIHVYNVVSPVIQIALQVIGIILWGLWGIIGMRLVALFLNTVVAWFLLNHESTADTLPSSVPTQSL
jgi:O-antigen/teichoic acid export membrane protein